MLAHLVLGEETRELVLLDALPQHEPAAQRVHLRLVIPLHEQPDNVLVLRNVAANKKGTPRVAQQSAAVTEGGEGGEDDWDDEG